MNMTVRRIAAASIAVAALTLTGCTFGSDVDKLVPTEGPLAMYPKPSGGLEEQLTGTLTLTDACVLVSTDDAHTALPVFPTGSATWEDDVLTYDDKPYRIGDEITLTGGVVAENQLGPMTYIPDGCDRTESFFVAP